MAENVPGGVEPERAEGSGGAFRAEHGRAARRPADLRQQMRVTPLGTTNNTKPRSIGRGFVLSEKGVITTQMSLAAQ